ncbi:hypothetical protein BH11MYX4_BH11MYX4_14930 [soil metagenome]
MSASPFFHTEVRPDRPSDAPLAVDTAGDTGATSLPVGWARLTSRIPPAWIGMSGYLVAGVLLGLVLIVALSLSRSDPPPKAGVVTDDVVRVHARDLGPACARAAKQAGKMTVSIEVGLDGKVRQAIAAGESPVVRGCVESHVRSWEFLPQATSSQMVLPFEIDPR